MNATLSINNGPEVPCDFSVEVDQVEVTSLGHDEPDPTWTFVDAAGHFHAYDHASTLPTLLRHEVWHAFDEPDEDEIDGWTEFVYRCPLCDEQVKPHWRHVSTPYRQFAPGRTSYELRFDTEAPDAFSAVIRAGDRMYFGFGRLLVAAALRRAGETAIATCGPLSWRPAVDPRAAS